jgi:hypothetical protein
VFEAKSDSLYVLFFVVICSVAARCYQGPWHGLSAQKTEKYRKINALPERPGGWKGKIGMDVRV